MDLENFIGLQNFKIEDFGKIPSDGPPKVGTLEDLLVLPVNDAYKHNNPQYKTEIKYKENKNINSNFKISTVRLEDNAAETSR